jgi:DNA-binding LacI/PurR family transcriptional regulator
MKPYELAAALTVLAVAALAYSPLSRGHRRLLLQRSAIFLGVPALTATLVLAPLELKTGNLADSLSLAGLAVSLLFGLGARTLDLRGIRMRLGIVIPSRAPFHKELRAGLREGLASIRAEIYDDYLIHSEAKENLSEFLPSLSRTLAWRPDYLVICSPSPSLFSDETVMRELASFHRRGGGIVFIDNPPGAAEAARIGEFGFVRADVECAAKVLSEYVAANAKDHDTVLVLNGPPSSEPAERYRKELEARLPHALIAFGDINGWTERAACRALKKHLEQGQHPRFVLCGNDVMGFGAVRALRESQPPSGGQWTTEVLGYNGIARALFAISEEMNPFSATVCLPPGTYGQQIAEMVVGDASRIFGRSRLHSRCIPIHDGQLVSADNVELYLED